MLYSVQEDETMTKGQAQTTLQRMAARDGYADLGDYGVIDEVAARQFASGADGVSPEDIQQVISRLESIIHPLRAARWLVPGCWSEKKISAATVARAADLLIDMIH